LVGIIRDITEEKRAQEKREGYMELLEYAQSVEKVGGWHIDYADATNQFWLDETYRIHEIPIGTRVSPEEGINYYAPEHVPLITAAYEGALRGLPYSIELDIITALGNRRHVHATGRPFLEEGKIVRMHGSFRDITESKRREEALRAQLALITEQQASILALSTPILKVWDEVIALPLIGKIDADRATRIMDRLLSEVVRVSARFAIVDLTGVDTVDATSADHLCRILRAVDLLGASARISGLTPAVAQTMATHGIDLSQFRTHRNLQEALQTCLRERSRKAGR
jgi:rsbT co-antagonist protein RsbR